MSLPRWEIIVIGFNDLTARQIHWAQIQQEERAWFAGLVTAVHHV